MQTCKCPVRCTSVLIVLGVTCTYYYYYITNIHNYMHTVTCVTLVYHVILLQNLAAVVKGYPHFNLRRRLSLAFPAPLRSNSPTPSLQQQNTTPHHPKHYPASTAPVPPQLHMVVQKLAKLGQPVSSTPPRLQGPTLTTPTLGDHQQQPPKDRLPQSSVPPMIMRPNLLSGVPPTHTHLTSAAPPQLSRATRLLTAPPPLRGAPQADTHMPLKASAPPPLRGVPRTDTRTPPVASAPPPLRGVSGADTYKSAPPLLRGAPQTDTHTSAPPPL